MVWCFNEFIGFDEDIFMCEMQVMFKFGIELCDWGVVGDCYLYVFGCIGYYGVVLFFYYYWLCMYWIGFVLDLWFYFINVVVVWVYCFMCVDFSFGSLFLVEIVYVFYFDVGLYV